MASQASQHANIHGSTNTVVQIIGSSNAVTIAGATTALRLREFLGPSFTEAKADPQRANTPGYTATGRRETRLLSPYNTTSLPLQGRTEELPRLQAWLAEAATVSVQVLLGGGGRGKTRLAV